MANRGINKVILIGNLGQDPEIRYMPNGNSVVNINLATSESWKDKNTGEKKEKTEWHRIVIFGKLAEIAAEYLKKGSQIYIEGSLHTRKWQDNNGTDKYITEIIVNMNGNMHMLGNRNTQNASSENFTHSNNKIDKKDKFLNLKNSDNLPIDFDEDIPF